MTDQSGRLGGTPRPSDVESSSRIGTVLLLPCGQGAAEERVAKGQTVYARECARCHMTDGTGVPGVHPNLAANPIVTLENPEPTIEIVLELDGSDRGGSRG